jgi:hypothetical protein
MSGFQFPYLTMIVSGVLAFLLGVFLYHPKVMGTRWMRARGAAAPPQVPNARKMILLLGLWLLAACFYTFLVNLLAIGDFPGLICLSCLLWVAFAMPPAVMSSLYTSYAFEAVAIDAAYQLSGYFIFAAVTALAKFAPWPDALRAMGLH